MVATTSVVSGLTVGDTVDSAPSTLRHIENVARLLNVMIEHLAERAVNHDASKLSIHEKDAFDWLTTLKARKEVHEAYWSVEYKKALDRIAPALRHHYGVNRHHPEHFAEGVNGMNLIDLLEMLCDWADASTRQPDGDLRESIRIGKERFGIDDQLASILLNTVDMLEEHGVPEVG
jgi:hypothetical protein